MDRRTSLRWMLMVATSLPLRSLGLTPVGSAANAVEAKPYGSDPKLIDPYHPGELWPLTLTPAQRQLATVLCDTIIPADASSPSASVVGVVDFVDEWISAPYPRQREDRATVLDGFAWFDAEAQRRHVKFATDLSMEQLHGICDDVCYLPKAKPEFRAGARFFARYRDLTMGGFYTTPQGRQDLQYIGNVPLPRFDGPPLEVLKKVGLA
ncbi:MAG: gluconate 2-dehydrogenase subunit 3 family protein [Proteobacteria bacterium]|nr:gluconate 2-dehydrogenase subunit 3 family protein [Pseudomonadota bacterium]